MAFLITGAQMRNKGAQAMLFITINELKLRFPNQEVFYMQYSTSEEYDESLYSFKKIPCNYYNMHAIVSEGIEKVYYEISSFFRDLAKLIIKKDKSFYHRRDLKKITNQIDAVIDISGFAIGDQWDRKFHQTYIDNINFAKKNNIPVYLMPQSFGPFNYTDDMKSIINPLGNALKYCRIVFAREKEGYDALHETFGLQNVELSTDIVLQNKEVNLDNIFCKTFQFHQYELPTEELVGIVPNQKCLIHGDENKILDLYKKIIDSVLKRGWNVVLFRHSEEDVSICRKLKAMYAANDDVILFDYELSCFEYDMFIRNFKFVVCSRFHGIVHAYRNSIPVIALGWAIKYLELAQNVGQEKYVFDIASCDFDADKIIERIDEMCETYKDNIGIIAANIKKIQKHNCFDLLERDLNSLKSIS